MNFEDLRELLRLELQRRIDAGTLTGTEIARQAGFKQAHISNFLNGKRALSLSGLDRVMAAQNLTVDQMMPVDLSASGWAGGGDDGGDGAGDAGGYDAGYDVGGDEGGGAIAAVPVVSSSTAMEARRVRAGSAIETVHVSASRLGDCRARPSAKSSGWQRFVAIRADAQQAAGMEPVIEEGATVVLDRHYNSLAPYRSHRRTLYAVRAGGVLALRFVDFDEGRLILRPLSVDFPVQLVALGVEETPGDYIVGRVCVVVSEL